MTESRGDQLVRLASTILESAKSLQAAENDTTLGKSAYKQTSTLLQAVSDLQLAATGPENFLKSLSYSYHDVSALSVIIEFDVAANVPLQGSISFRELAAKTQCPEQRLTRVLRLLAVRRIFTEPTAGYVGHSAASACLAQNKPLAAFLAHCTHEAFPAASRLKDSMRLHPSSEEPNNAGFNLAFATDDPLFTFLSKDPARFDRFNLGMAGISQAGGRSGSQVVNGFDWSVIESGTVVDVGGGNGHIAIALAEAYPSLKLVVQDLETAVDAGRLSLPPSLADRVTFEAHDMFKEQTVKGASVYYLRHILHDWPDAWAVTILKALVPALKPGSRILISDSVIPPPGQMDALDEKFVRYLDMQMMVLHNSRERTEEDFVELLQRASPRLQFQQTWRRGESVSASTMVEALFV